MRNKGPACKAAKALQRMYCSRPDRVRLLRWQKEMQHAACRRTCWAEAQAGVMVADAHTIAVMSTCLAVL